MVSDETRWSFTTLDEERRGLLGELAVLAGELEYNVNALAVILIDPSDFSIGDAVTHRMQFNATRELCDRVLPLRVDDEPDLIDEWKRVSPSAAAAMKGRNDLLHSYWRSHLGELDASNFRLDRKGRHGARELVEVTAADIEGAATSLQATGIDTRNLLAGVAHHLGVLEQFVDRLL